MRDPWLSDPADARETVCARALGRPRCWVFPRWRCLRRRSSTKTAIGPRGHRQLRKSPGNSIWSRRPWVQTNTTRVLTGVRRRYIEEERMEKLTSDFEAKARPELAWAQV